MENIVTLREIFSEYDVFLFPTMAENYGHVIFEAMAGGCVPIISDRTPWNNEKARGALSYVKLTESNECLSAFEDEINKYIKLSADEMQNRADACILFSSAYRADEAENQYREIFSK